MLRDKMGGESNGSVYKRCGMECTNEVKWCSGMGVKIMLKLFCHMERKKSEEFVKKVYVSEID